jgi:hypothetical protein
MEDSVILGDSFSVKSDKGKRKRRIERKSPAFLPRPFNDSDSSRDNRLLSEDLEAGTPREIKQKEEEGKKEVEK